MQSLELNLASRPFKNNTLVWAGLLFAVAAVAAVTTWNVRTYRDNVVLLEDLQQTVGTFDQLRTDLEGRAELVRRQLRRYDLDEIRTRTAKANDFIRWKAFSWTRLFNQLQAVLPWDVQMTSVRPIFGTTRRRRGAVESGSDEAVPINVEGRARTIEAFLDFEEALFADPHFSNVQPEAYETDENTGETVFRMRFYYTAVTSEERQRRAAPSPAAETPAVRIGRADGAAGAGGGR